MTHWWKTYAAEIDESADMLRIFLPSGERVWKLDELGSLCFYGKSTVINHGTAADNILTGAAIGGKAGAFVAAMGPTGTRAYLDKLGLIVCRKAEKQIAFGVPAFCYSDENKELIPLPAHWKLENFVIAASNAVNAILEKRNKK